MASAIGTALISTILKPMAAKAMAMVVDKVDGVVNIEREISSLQTTLRTIEGIVQVAEEKQIDDVFIRNWLRDLVDIAYEARDVLDDFNINFPSCIITEEETSNPVNFIFSLMLFCFGGSSSDTSKLPLAILNRLEKDIRSVRERFDEKKKEGETFATLKSVVGGGSESVREYRRPEVGPYLNQQGDYKIVEREEVKQPIMEKILHPSDDSVHVVAICGMGGIGKTTLAQFIYNNQRVKKVPRSWLCVGVNKFSAEKVIREIVNDQNTTGIGNLQTKLEKELRGDRFLIVLDDVWDVAGSEWDLLFNPLTNVGKGGLIIITTRRREVCAATNTQTTYDLEPLSEKDSWSIFESCAYINGKSDSTPDLKCIGMEIVKKLNGLPLALKVVGCSLLDKDYSTWTNFLESKLTKDDEVMSALRWSYNHLPRHLKTCFMYCSLFPKDHVFIKNVLVEMWMAHDLIQKEAQKRPEDVGAHYLKQLVNASLLQCVDGKHVMHDLIHELALHVSNGEFANANGSLSIDQMEKVRHITITPGDYLKIPRLCNTEKLLTLYATPYQSFTPDMFDLQLVFKQLKSIRVLVLDSRDTTDIPDCISELRHLRYLDVSKSRVKSLPDSLCHLNNLQMIAAPLTDSISSPHGSFKIKGVKLPRDIVNISSLRYVRANLSTCKGIGKLTSLQELSSIHVCEGDNIRELGDMQILRGKLSIDGLMNVSTLEGDGGALMEKQTLMDELVLQSTISKEVLDVLGCPPNLTYLQINGYTGVKSPSWMVDRKHKFDKLKTLELSRYGVKRLGDEFYGNLTKSKVFFPSLESLRFSRMQDWEEWDDIIIHNSNVSVFPRLTRLEIDECRKLVSVLPVVKNRTSIMNATNFMTCLSRLKISHCDGLKRLELDALVSLTDLDISCCSSLVHITSGICLATTIERLQISQCDLLETMDFERLPSLKHLDVSFCEKLISIPRLLGIKFLDLFECKSLRSLSFRNVDGLDSLDNLTILSCPVLELTFEEGSSSSSSGNSVAVPLDNIYTDNMQVFKIFSGLENFDQTEESNFCKFLFSKDTLFISQCEDLKSFHFHKLSSLKSLTIDSCPKLQSLPPDFHKLSSLKNLHINYCPQFQSLSLDFHRLSSLKSLSICNSPKLQSLPPDFHRLSSLESLEIKNCPQLQSLPPDFHKLSSLERIKIESCPQLQSLTSCINSLVIAYQQPLEERCKLESGHVWHQFKDIRSIYLSDGVHNYISVFLGTLWEYSVEEAEEEEILRDDDHFDDDQRVL